MIIPSITLPQTELSSPEFNSADLVGQIKHWSLFGQLALRKIQPHQVSLLEKVIRQTGGGVDLWVEVDAGESGDAPDLEAHLLMLLNAGASLVLSSAAQADSFETIPQDRVRHCLVEPSLDQAIPANHAVHLEDPSADRIAELEMARIDVLVAADQLQENTEMIVDFFESVLVTDRPDGLWSTLIVDPRGVALGLAYSNAESLSHAIENRVGAYHSRSRAELWIKGESSGATQNLLGVRFDCDRDCLCFQVTQSPPGFCHRDTYTCFGDQRTLESVVQRLVQRIEAADEQSFTRKLANDPDMLAAKLREEAEELAEANHAALADKNEGHERSVASEIIWEAADVLYFSLVAMIKHGVSMADVEQELTRRMTRVVRRKNKLESNESS